MDELSGLPEAVRRLALDRFRLLQPHLVYMRGLDEHPFLHVTHRGAPGFLAAGFEAASMKDLEALAQEENALLA
jgi:hypothetical protein